MAKSVLIVEDDRNIADLLRLYLEKEGYVTAIAADGGAGVELFRRLQPDLVLLDVMLPVMDGWGVLRTIRQDSQTPVIMLTAKGETSDKVAGLKMGADDYITKPFSMEELLLRIEAVLRRAGAKRPTEDATYKFGKFIFDTNKQTLTINGIEDKLTTKESDLLALLCANSNEILERNMALKTIWEEDSYFNARSMDVYITKLRKRLKDDPEVEIINVHGKGYKLVFPQDS